MPISCGDRNLTTQRTLEVKGHARAETIVLVQRAIPVIAAGTKLAVLPLAALRIIRSCVAGGEGATGACADIRACERPALRGGLEGAALRICISLSSDAATIVKRRSACNLAPAIGVCTNSQRAAGVLVPAAHGMKRSVMASCW